MIWYYALSVIVSFIAVLLKVFQQKNVVGRHLRAIAMTSYLMALFDVAAIKIVVDGGLWVALSSGTGAAAGALCAVQLHDKVFNTKEKTHA